MLLAPPTPSLSSGFARSPSESEFPELWSGLVGLWAPCVGNQGITSIMDLSGYRRDGVMNGSIPASAWTTSPLGAALTFDGSNDYLETGFTSSFTGLTPFSFVAWVKSTDANRGCVAGDYISAAALNPMEITAAGKARAYLSGGAGVIKDYTGPTTVNDGRWHCLGITYNGSQTLRIFVDGLEETSVTKTVDNTLTSATLGSGSAMRIGSDRRAASGIFLAGDIAMVAAYARALTSAEIMMMWLGASPLALREGPEPGALGDALTHISGSRAASWNVRQKLSGSRAASWNVRQKLSGSRATTWAVRQKISGARAASWNVASLTPDTEPVGQIKSSIRPGAVGNRVRITGVSGKVKRGGAA